MMKATLKIKPTRFGYMWMLPKYCRGGYDLSIGLVENHSVEDAVAHAVWYWTHRAELLVL